MMSGPTVMPAAPWRQQIRSELNLICLSGDSVLGRQIGSIIMYATWAPLAPGAPGGMRLEGPIPGAPAARGGGRGRGLIRQRTDKFRSKAARRQTNGTRPAAFRPRSVQNGRAEVAIQRSHRAEQLG